MAPLGAPRSATCLPSLRCGDSCRHFVCCSSCSCCCCHCGLWWAWSRSTGETEEGKGGGVVLGFVKSFCALLKNWNAASRARKFFIFVDFWLRVLTNNKVAQLPFVFQFCTFLCPLPLSHSSPSVWSSSFNEFRVSSPTPTLATVTAHLSIFSVLVVRLLWQYFPPSFIALPPPSSFATFLIT